jgi:hypothetical protein
VLALAVSIADVVAIVVASLLLNVKQRDVMHRQLIN